MWYTEEMVSVVPLVKVELTRNLARGLLEEVKRGRRWVCRKRLATLCGFAVSLHFPLTLALFYIRSLYDELSDWGRVTERAARSILRTRLCNRA